MAATTEQAVIGVRGCTDSGAAAKMHVRRSPGEYKTGNDASVNTASSRPAVSTPQEETARQSRSGFSEYTAVIFVHGCFWHSHGCYKTTVPETRRTFWEDKLRTNRERDVRSVRLLHEMGWRVMIVWECAVRGKTRLPSYAIADSVTKWLHSSELFAEISSGFYLNSLSLH